MPPWVSGAHPDRAIQQQREDGRVGGDAGVGEQRGADGTAKTVVTQRLRQDAELLACRTYA
jgi:hypothetical protein